MSNDLLLLPNHFFIAELCKKSLFEFLKEFWEEFITDPYEHNWHIEYLCDEIQLVLDKYILEREPHIKADKWYNGILENIEKNLIINVPPGTSKTSILSRATPAWLWANDSSKTWISNTIDEKNATEFSTATLKIINSDKYKLYYPEVKIRRDVSAKTFYSSDKGGTRYSLTTRGSNTGKHAHVISDDDPMDYKTAQSHQEANICINGFKSLQTRKKDKRKSVYFLMMQRLSNIDTTAHALKSLKSYRHICLPAEDIYSNIKPEGLRKFYVDGLLDPNRLNRAILEEQRKGLSDENMPISEIAYNIQFNQISQTSQGLLYPNLKKVNSLPENRDGAVRYSFTDVADTGSDYFSTWFVEVNNGKVYVFDAIYTQEGSAVSSQKLKEKILLHNSVVNKLEVNNQGSVFITLMQQLGVNVSGYLSTGNKEAKISAWAQFVSFLHFVEPNTQPYHTNEYTMALKHIEAYPKQGKSSDGHDDAEDSLTELLRYFWTNLRHLFNS